MIAHVTQFEWDNFWLTMNRLVLGTGAAWAFMVTLRILRVGKDTSKRQGVIPSPILYFTLFWSGTLFVYISELILLDRLSVSEGPERVFYAFAIAWTIFGLTWILSIGGKAAHLGRVIETVEEVKKAGRDES